MADFPVTPRRCTRCSRNTRLSRIRFADTSTLTTTPSRLRCRCLESSSRPVGSLETQTYTRLSRQDRLKQCLRFGRVDRSPRSRRTWASTPSRLGGSSGTRTGFQTVTGFGNIAGCPVIIIIVMKERKNMRIKTCQFMCNREKETGCRPNRHRSLAAKRV